MILFQICPKDNDLDTFVYISLLFRIFLVNAIYRD